MISLPPSSLLPYSHSAFSSPLAPPPSDLAPVSYPTLSPAPSEVDVRATTRLMLRDGERSGQILCSVEMERGKTDAIEWVGIEVDGFSSGGGGDDHDIFIHSGRDLEAVAKRGGGAGFSRESALKLSN